MFKDDETINRIKEIGLILIDYIEDHPEGSEHTSIQDFMEILLKSKKFEELREGFKPSDLVMSLHILEKCDYVQRWYAIKNADGDYLPYDNLEWMDDNIQSGKFLNPLTQVKHTREDFPEQFETFFTFNRDRLKNL